MEHADITITDIPEGRDLLFDILAWARPHGSQTDKMFCREYLDVIPGMQEDGMGNRYLRIGTSPVLWSCHVDTVDRKEGLKSIYFNETTGIASLGGQGKPGQCLGADDGAGVWMLMEMIKRNVEGLYVFHRGEEVGCIGSGWIAKHNPTFLDGITMAIAFDRKDHDNVITFQSSGRCCSDTFAKALGAALNAEVDGFKYDDDDTGLFTDTNEYTSHIPECTNLSVGYSGAHGPLERLDVFHLEALLEAICKVDMSALPIDRDPSVTEYKTYAGYGGGYTGGSWMANQDPLYRKVYSQAQLVADFLEANGVTLADIEAFDRDRKAGEALAKKAGVVLELLPEHKIDASSEDALNDSIPLALAQAMMAGVITEGDFIPVDDDGEIDPWMHWTV